MSASTTTKTPSIATAFIRKLYRMLDMEDVEVIGWDADGLSFSIRDEVALDERVLPRYFRGRVDVFRQHLAEHGFQRTSTAGAVGQLDMYTHEHFIRGEPNRLSLIVRTPTTKRRRSKMTKRKVETEATSSRSTAQPTSELDPNFIDDDGFDLCSLIKETTGSCPPHCAADRINEDQRNEDLHSSLVRMLALHATNPVVGSAKMLNVDHLTNLTATMASPNIPTASETQLFTPDMMASMVEWLDASA